MVVFVGGSLRNICTCVVLKNVISLISRVLIISNCFRYLNPLFQKGSKTRIEVTDIHATLREYSSSKLGKETER